MRRRPQLIRALWVAGLLAGCPIAAGGVSIATAATAAAVGTSGAAPFSLAPAPVKGKKPFSYFQLNMAPGATETESVVVSDAGRNPETLKLSPSEGTTAPNSGIAYTDAYKPCKGTACWVRGLPPTVSLGAGQSKKVTFTVTVPAGTPQLQYLAGVTAQPATNPAPVVVGKKGGATAQAIVINQVTVGVAVTVGPLAALRSALRITRVTTTAIQALPRLLIGLENVGQRFTGAQGTALCTSGSSSHSYKVFANTILPGQSATVPVNVLGLKSRSVDHCSVSLSYGSGAAATTAWHGTVKISSLKAPKQYHVGPGVYASVPPQKFPSWAIYVMAGGGALLVILLGTTIVLVRRSRRHRRTTDGATPAPTG